MTRFEHLELSVMELGPEKKSCAKGSRNNNKAGDGMAYLVCMMMTLPRIKRFGGWGNIDARPRLMGCDTAT